MGKKQCCTNIGILLFAFELIVFCTLVRYKADYVAIKPNNSGQTVDHMPAAAASVFTIDIIRCKHRFQSHADDEQSNVHR